jgi:naphthalene 1,2-dioxygenase system ferredoxin subunit/p-cumate 2,3-dioxygenase ferredoxin subunit
MALTRLCFVSEVSQDDGLRVELPGHCPLAVWIVDDCAYVTDDNCTHGAASLVSLGLLTGYTIECGLHQGAFDVRDGSILSAPCVVPLKCYRTEIVENAVFADL